MNEHMLPDDAAPDAASALVEIARRQRQVIALAALPNWYWWAVGGLMVVLAAGVDVRTAASISIAVPVFVVGMLAVTGAVTLRPFRRALPRNDLLGPPAVLAILGFVGTIVGGVLAIAFSLRAGGVPFPATLGCLAGALGLGFGGPVLARYLTRVMLSNRTGARR